MSINEDFQILAKKLDNCELLTNYNLNVLNEDMMLLQNAFIGALVTRDISEMERLLNKEYIKENRINRITRCIGFKICSDL